MDTARRLQEDLDQWRVNPMTLLVVKGMRAVNLRKHQAASAAYWAGNPWPEADRLAILQAEQWLDEMMTASAADFTAAMETDDE